ncbi:MULTISPECIES: substrate-binding periplasmic protein [unclassified Agarivorans]|uniref:substrate-binding periplasmic protein n=1 Tax=unclassified Agarivorans TaxID=2636026 RepID=UPI003D7D2134
MKYRIKLLIACSLFTSIQLQAHTLEELSYMSEDFFPYNYVEQQQPQGFAVELLSLVFQQLGSPLPEIQFLPWKRAYAKLQQLPYTVLFSTIKTAQRESKFKWACPINIGQANLYALNDSKIEITALADLANYKVALLSGQSIHAYLNDAGLQHNIVAIKTIEQAFKLLALRRVDLLALVSEHIDPHELSFKQVYSLFDNEYCYAFHPSVSEPELRRFQRALQLVVSSASYQKLYQKYFK